MIRKVLFLFVFIFIISNVYSATIISSLPYNITISGDYELNVSLNTTESAINIQANNVNLDCKGYTLTGDRSGIDSGVYSTSSYTNLNISNCNTVNFQYGVRSIGDSVDKYTKIINFTSYNSTSYGIAIGGNYNTINNATIYSTSRGLRLLLSAGGNFGECTSSNNVYSNLNISNISITGIEFWICGACNTTISNVLISDVMNNGITSASTPFSENITFQNITITNTKYALNIDSLINSHFTNITLYNNIEGLKIDFNWNHSFSNLNIYNNSNGVIIYDSNMGYNGSLNFTNSLIYNNSIADIQLNLDVDTYGACSNLFFSNVTDNFGKYHVLINGSRTVDGWTNLSSVNLCNASNAIIKNLNSVGQNNKSTFLSSTLTQNASLSNLNITGYNTAIYFFNSSNNSISNSSFTLNNYGLSFVSNTSYNKVSNNTIKYNNIYDIYFQNDSYYVIIIGEKNEFYNNYFHNSTKIYSENWTYVNYFNSSLLGYNIGNFWDDLSCSSYETRGSYKVCSNPANYTINSTKNIYDFAPLIIAPEYVSPTPANNSNLGSSSFTIRVQDTQGVSSWFNVTINGISYAMINTSSTDYEYTLNDGFNEITEVIFNVSYAGGIMDTRTFTYYPDYTDNVFVSYGFVSFFISIILIVLLFFNLNFKKNKNKKGVSEIITIISLLLVVVTIGIFVNNWYQDFSTSYQTKKLGSFAVSANSFEVLAIKNESNVISVYLKSKSQGYSIIERINVNSIDCTIVQDNVILGNSITPIQIECSSLDIVNNLIVIYSKKAVFSANLPLLESSAVVYSSCLALDSTQLNHSQSFSFYNSSYGFSTCYSQNRTCSDGTINGSSTYNYSMCFSYYDLSCVTDLDADSFINSTCAIYSMTNTTLLGHLDTIDTNSTIKPDMSCIFNDYKNSTSCLANFVVDGCGSGTVQDIATGLCWQRDMTNTGTQNWSNSVSYCDGLSQGGNTDWRLPSKMELATILDSALASPAVVGGNNNKFQNVPNGVFWTYNTNLDNTLNAWNFWMERGMMSNAAKSTATYYAVCVRP